MEILGKHTKLETTDPNRINFNKKVPVGTNISIDILYQAQVSEATNTYFRNFIKKEFRIELLRYRLLRVAPIIPKTYFTFKVSLRTIKINIKLPTAKQSCIPKYDTFIRKNTTSYFPKIHPTNNEKSIIEQVKEKERSTTDRSSIIGDFEPHKPKDKEDLERIIQELSKPKHLSGLVQRVSGTSKFIDSVQNFFSFYTKLGPFSPSNKPFNNPKKPNIFI